MRQEHGSAAARPRRSTLRRRFFTVLAGTAGLLLMINVAYLTSLSPGSDLDVDLLDNGVVIPTRRRRAVSISAAPPTRNLSSICSGGGAPVAPPHDPMADARAIIEIGGTLRLTVLSMRTLRIEHKLVRVLDRAPLGILVLEALRHGARVWTCRARRAEAWNVLDGPQIFSGSTFHPKT